MDPVRHSKIVRHDTGHQLLERFESRLSFGRLKLFHMPEIFSPLVKEYLNSIGIDFLCGTPIATKTLSIHPPICLPVRDVCALHKNGAI